MSDEPPEDFDSYSPDDPDDLRWFQRRYPNGFCKRCGVYLVAPDEGCQSCGTPTEAVAADPAAETLRGKQWVCRGGTLIPCVWFVKNDHEFHQNCGWEIPFGPGHREWCPVGDPDEASNHGHCGHWYECEPCHRCGDDTPDPDCDCDRCTAFRAADPAACGVQVEP